MKELGSGEDRVKCWGRPTHTLAWDSYLDNLWYFGHMLMWSTQTLCGLKAVTPSHPPGRFIVSASFLPPRYFPPRSKLILGEGLGMRLMCRGVCPSHPVLVHFDLLIHHLTLQCGNLALHFINKCHQLVWI